MRYTVFSSCATFRVTRLLEKHNKSIIVRSVCHDELFSLLRLLMIPLTLDDETKLMLYPRIILKYMFFLYIFIEYGRTCKDIGCLPRETCVMSYDTCSFNQQEGTNCGRYPTCQKRTDMQTPQQNINTGKYIGMKKRIVND